MHCMVAVFDQSHYNTKYKGNRDQRDRMMWREPEFSEKDGGDFNNISESFINVKQGFYLFGGCDADGCPQNDIWLIEPDYDYNTTKLNASTGTFFSNKDPSLSINLTKLTSIKGKPPIPRFQASMVNVQANNCQLVVIYGGRNDQIFTRTNNVALNDICVLNLNTREWEPVAMFGHMPCSRWSHSMIASNGFDVFNTWDEDMPAQNDKLFIFGGIMLNSYCRTKVYTFHFQDNTHLNTAKIDQVQTDADRKMIEAPNYLRKFIMRKVEVARKEAAKENMTLLDGTPISLRHEQFKE